MRFVCRWLSQGIEEVSTEMDAQVILDAATRAIPIWPEDIDLPEDDEGAGRGYHIHKSASGEAGGE